jgi:hypothetical protein
VGADITGPRETFRTLSRAWLALRVFAQRVPGSARPVHARHDRVLAAAGTIASPSLHDAVRIVWDSFSALNPHP